MLRLFKTVAILEGISYLLLFFNMLVIKRFDMALYKLLLYPIGMSHGILFMLYLLLAILLIKPQKWTFLSSSIIIAASLLPFATFYVEKKYVSPNLTSTK